MRRTRLAVAATVLTVAAVGAAAVAAAAPKPKPDSRGRWIQGPGMAHSLLGEQPAALGHYVV